MQWQLIETARQDVERCLLWCADLHKGPDEPPVPRGTVFGRIKRGTPRGEGMSGDWKFTHWMPLPAPPEAANKGDTSDGSPDIPTVRKNRTVANTLKV